MPIQMRLSQNDNRMYSPDRDLAYCAPHLIHHAISGLDPEYQEPWVKAYIEDNNITDDLLVSAAEVAAKYLNETLTDPKHVTPYDALTTAGLFELPPAVQTLLLAKLGQIFLQAVFPSIRDVTRNPADPPYDTKQIAEIAARTVANIKAPRATKKASWWTFLTSWLKG